MGMSASQARFLSLTARKTNVEFEGQQINQQRTCLSNESSNYYSQLSSMAVPIPPSSADYTKVSYTFEDGNTQNTITSLLANKITADSGLYKVNYTTTDLTDTMVAGKNSVVQRSGNAENYVYSIGNVQLKQAISVDDPTSIVVNDSNREGYKLAFAQAGIALEDVNKMSDEEIANRLKIENQYRAIASEKYGTDDWYVRYEKTSTEYGYEPVFYKKSDLESINYNNTTSQSLGGVKSYVWGQTTETREIKDSYAKVTSDSSGRYQSITIYNDNDIDIQTQQIDTRTPEEIARAEEWLALEPQEEDYIMTVEDQELYEPYEEYHSDRLSRFNDNRDLANYSHYIEHEGNALLRDETIGYKYCYASTGNYVLVSRSGGVRPRIESFDIYSESIRNGYIPENSTNKYTIMANEHTNTETDVDKYLSSYYIDNNLSTDEDERKIQILLSNYYKTDDGEIKLKTLEQKIIDLWACLYITRNTGNASMFEEFAEFRQNILYPIYETVGYDILHLNLNGYNYALEEWQNSKPENSEPVYEEREICSINGQGTTYNLTVTTVTDEKGYNDAMNQYFYDKAVYDQKVQEINAKIEVIQIQDKNLELKLKQLDTEQNAISTELDAVKKVLTKNVESSFKTFNA